MEWQPEREARYIGTNITVGQEDDWGPAWQVGFLATHGVNSTTDLQLQVLKTWEKLARGSRGTGSMRTAYIDVRIRTFSAHVRAVTLPATAKFLDNAPAPILTNKLLNALYSAPYRVTQVGLHRTGELWCSICARCIGIITACTPNLQSIFSECWREY
jgi:hypothetical protein